MQIVRCDPTIATGFAPSELLLGRKLVYPFELKNIEIDFEGVELTAPLVQNLSRIHDQNFRQATKAIKKAQRRYKQRYDKRNKAEEFKLKSGDRVQYKRYASRRTLSTTYVGNWCPTHGYYTIFKVDAEKKRVILQNSNGTLLKRSQPFDRVRKFKGKL